MHIAINGWFARQLTTGSGQYLHYLLQSLPATEKDLRLSLLLPFPRSARHLRELRDSWPDVALMRVKTPRLPEQIGKLWWEQVAVPLATKKLQADLLWVPYWAAPLWQPCPVVVTVHDMIHRLLPAYRGGRLQQLYTELVSMTARRSAAAITVSHAAARDIHTELQIPKERVHVVYNGLSAAPQIEAQQCALVKARYRLPDRYFLYLGGFDVRKNVRTTLLAYQRYLEKGGDPAVQFVFAGKLPDGNSDFAPNPKTIATELDLLTQVHFCGYVDETDKAAIYHLATAFIFPSLYEGFGLMALEAMQAGTPVVTSDR